MLTSKDADPANVHNAMFSHVFKEGTGHAKRGSVDISLQNVIKFLTVGNLHQTNTVCAALSHRKSRKI